MLFIRGSVGSSLGRNVQLLSGKDLVGILEEVSVRLVDALPGVGVAVMLLGDLRQRVAGLHDVGGGGGRTATALDVGEVGAGAGIRRGAAAALHIGEVGAAAALHVGEVGFLFMSHFLVPPGEV